MELRWNSTHLTAWWFQNDSKKIGLRFFGGSTWFHGRFLEGSSYMVPECALALMAAVRRRPGLRTVKKVSLLWVRFVGILLAWNPD